MKTPYAAKYFPPAPVFSIHLAVQGQAPQIGPEVALIDTGADGTFVPTAFLEELSIPAIYMANVRSHLAAEIHRVSVYKIDIVFDSIRLPGIEVVADDWNSEIIVGRNVLNKLQLLLDGPRQTTEFK